MDPIGKEKTTPEILSFQEISNGRTPWTEPLKSEYLIALYRNFRNLGLRWDSAPFKFFMDSKNFFFILEWKGGLVLRLWPVLTFKKSSRHVLDSRYNIPMILHVWQGPTIGNFKAYHPSLPGGYLHDSCPRGLPTPWRWAVIHPRFGPRQMDQRLLLVPLKHGGIGSILLDPQKARTISGIYKWYILPIGGLYITYHLLREPEKSYWTKLRKATNGRNGSLVPFLTDPWDEDVIFFCLHEWLIFHGNCR